MIDLAVDMSPERIDAKFPENEDVQSFLERELGKCKTWLHYLCDDDDDDDDAAIEGQAPLMRQFESARQDLSDLLDSVLKPKASQRPNSTTLVQQLSLLKQKYITAEEEQLITVRQATESGSDTATESSSNSQGSIDHDVFDQDGTHRSSAEFDLEPPNKRQKTGEEKDDSLQDANE